MERFLLTVLMMWLMFIIGIYYYAHSEQRTSVRTRGAGGQLPPPPSPKTSALQVSHQ